MNIAIITGASAGLGQAFFRSVTKRYPDLESVWVVARRADRLTELAQNSPVPVEVLPLDLADTASYAALEQKLAAEKPTVRILINNAGLGELNNVADSDWKTQIRMVDVNCRGLTAVTTAVLPYMPAGGFIINVASIAAFAPNPRLTVYSSTKAYVLSLSKGLRYELRERRINVLAVCPGPMRTEFLDVAGITGRSDTFARLPYCDPEQVADRAVQKAAAGRGVYTNRLSFKFYRVIAKLAPHNWIMPMSQT